MFNKPDEKTTFRKITKAYMPQPKIKITPYALYKMKNYVKEFDIEIAWLALVKRVSQFEFLIYDTVFLKQDITATTAEIDEGAIAEYGNKLITEGKYDEYNAIKCWGHSHVNMGVFASGTDESQFTDFYKNCDYFIRLICNKKDEMKVDIVLVDEEMRWDNCSFEIEMTQEIETINTQIIELDAQRTALQEQLLGLLKNDEDTATIVTTEELKTTEVIRPRVGFYAGTGGVVTYSPTSTNQTKEIEKEVETAQEAYKKDWCIKVIVNQGTENEGYMRVDKIFSNFMIESIYEDGLCAEELNKKYGMWLKFDKYSRDDWEDLKEAIYIFYEDYLIDDTTTGVIV